MKENENIINETVKYFDSLVTMMNPGINAPISDQHLCKKHKDEIRDNQQDYIKLINKLQWHIRCSPSYCFRVKNGQQSCRFGYPKENINHTFIRNDSHGQPELIMKRNNLLINLHSKF